MSWTIDLRRLDRNYFWKSSSKCPLMKGTNTHPAWQHSYTVNVEAVVHNKLLGPSFITFLSCFISSDHCEQLLAGPHLSPMSTCQLQITISKKDKHWKHGAYRPGTWLSHCGPEYTVRSSQQGPRVEVMGSGAVWLPVVQRSSKSKAWGNFEGPKKGCLRPGVYLRGAGAGSIFLRGFYKQKNPAPRTLD